MKLFNSENKKIGICFSGGGALGFAHIGVIRAFEEYGLQGDIISGASMGAIIGALYAHGYTSTEMEEMVQTYKTNSFLRLIKFNVMRGVGLSSHKKVEDILRQLLPHESFDELKRKFYLSVTDILTPEWKIVDSGDLIQYILASMSIPLLFEPILINGKYLVDGGIMNNLPVEPLVENNCYVIGIDVQDAFENDEKIGVGMIAKRIHSAMTKESQKPRVAKCDLYINFPELRHYHIEDFGNHKEIIEIGYQRTKAVLQGLEKISKII